LCTSKDRTFEYLNTRIHTRESSTLTFATVTFSASLLFLGLVVGMENPLSITSVLGLLTAPANLQPFVAGLLYDSYKIFQGLNILLTSVGLIILILGFIYREVTIRTIDYDDYKTLKTWFKVDLDMLSKRSKTVRALIVYGFFSTVLGAWSIYIALQLF